MQCPACQSPLLFGATECGCGYRAENSAPLAIELSYGEALRAYWRIYWPLNLLGVLLAIVMPRLSVALLGPAEAIRLAANPWVTEALQLAWLACGTFVLLSRVTSGPFRGFVIHVVDADRDDGTALPLTLRRRTQAWLFLLWRLVAGNLLIVLLSAPANAILSLARINAGIYIAILANLFVVGPIVLKMLIGNRFADFRLEAVRRGKVT